MESFCCNSNLQISESPISSFIHVLLGTPDDNKTDSSIDQSFASPNEDLIFQGKGSWTEEEDKTLKSLYHQFGTQWKRISTFLPGRNGKQCRERFVNHLDDSVTKSKWTRAEDDKLRRLQKEYGNKWSFIASQMPGRSACAVKNRWKSSNFKSNKEKVKVSTSINKDTFLLFIDNIHTYLFNVRKVKVQVKNAGMNLQKNWQVIYPLNHLCASR